MLLLQTPWGQPCSVLGKSDALISRELFFLDNFPGWDHALTFTDQYNTHRSVLHDVLLSEESLLEGDPLRDIPPCYVAVMDSSTQSNANIH